jgi:hypothetical protein
MTAAGVRGSLLRRAAIIALAALVPGAAWSAWDYVEARRLSSAVKEIQSRGEPVTTPIRRVPRQFQRSAGAYYDAAAVLIDRAALSEVETALYFGRGERAANIARLRAWLEANREADRLLDLGTSAEFTAVQAYQDHLRWDRLMRVSSLARARVVERLDAHDGEGAAAALVRQLQIARAMDAAASDWVPFFFERALGDFGDVLSSRVSPAALEQLQKIVRTYDREDLIRADAMNSRAVLIESLWNPASDWYGRPPGPFYGNPLEPLVYFLLRPWLAHKVTRELRRLDEALAVSTKPWPDRLKSAAVPMPVIDARRWRFLDTPADTVAYLHQQRARAYGRLLATLRTADAAAAVERYRAAHGGSPPETLDVLVPAFLERVPIDPFTGVPVKWKASPASYTIYSVGSDFKDDGGRTSQPQWKPGLDRQERERPDIGVEVALEPGT